MGVPRWSLILVMLVGFVHGLFYAVIAPPWDLFDEGTHLAYALTLRDEHRIPRLDEYHRQDIIDSEIETDRWEVFRVGRPDVSSPETMGLGGRLYQGYQPPLYYLLILPATVVKPDDPLATMYLARLLGPVLLALFAGVTWGLARTWFPQGARNEDSAVSASSNSDNPRWKSHDILPLSAGLMVTLVPAAGAAAGRVNNDLLAATLISAGLLSATILHARPTILRAIVVGLLTVAAILTKAHGFLLLPVVGVVLLDMWKAGRLPLAMGALALAPGIIAACMWSLWTYLRYGVWSGTAAFLDFARPFEPLPAIEFIRAIWFHAWSSYWSEYGGGWLELLTGILIAVLIMVATIGLVRGPRPGLALVLSGVLAACLIIGLWSGNLAGFVYPQGRVLLPIFPALSALTIGGWAALLGTRGSLFPVVTLGTASLLFVTTWYLPFFYG